MTENEAIEYIKNMAFMCEKHEKCEYGNQCTTKCLNATKMAIKALEEIQQYKVAEEQGLLLRLPVAIGQTVYTNHSMQGWYCRSSNRPYEAEVVYIGLNNCEESGGGYINISFKGKKGCMLSFTFKEIGITWFLTKEEAEQALKQMGE